MKFKNYFEQRLHKNHDSTFLNLIIVFTLG